MPFKAASVSWKRLQTCFSPSSQMTGQLDERRRCISWSPVRLWQMVTPWCVCVLLLVQMATPQMTSSSTGKAASRQWRGWRASSCRSSPSSTTNWCPKTWSSQQVNAVLCGFSLQNWPFNQPELILILLFFWVLIGLKWGHELALKPPWRRWQKGGSSGPTSDHLKQFF